jgi:hypothetical protein
VVCVLASHGLVFCLSDDNERGAVDCADPATPN